MRRLSLGLILVGAFAASPALSDDIMNRVQGTWNGTLSTDNLDAPGYAQSTPMTLVIKGKEAHFAPKRGHTWDSTAEPAGDDKILMGAANGKRTFMVAEKGGKLSMKSKFVAHFNGHELQFDYDLSKPK